MSIYVWNNVLNKLEIFFVVNLPFFDYWRELNFAESSTEELIGFFLLTRSYKQETQSRLSYLKHFRNTIDIYLRFHKHSSYRAVIGIALRQANKNCDWWAKTTRQNVNCALARTWYCIVFVKGTVLCRQDGSSTWQTN